MTLPKPDMSGLTTRQRLERWLAIANRLRKRLENWHNTRAQAILDAGGTAQDVAEWRESVWRPLRDKLHRFRRRKAEARVAKWVENHGEVNTQDDALYPDLVATIEAIEPEDEEGL